MHYTGTTYRPPFESRSLLLQATVGCSHNRCTFCTMYRTVPFSVEPLEQIEEDLREARDLRPNVERVFLENGDAFVLSADKLLTIAAMIHDYLPRVKTITMYASIKNIRDKTDDALRALRRAGIDELNVGVESGYDPALLYMNKDHDHADAVRQLGRLRAAGMEYALNIILGCAGSGHGAENAAETARLLNETQPFLIFTGTLHSEPGCPLHDDLQSGAFVENTIAEYLDEEEALVSALELKRDCRWFGLHPSNVVEVDAMLPRDRDRLLSLIRRTRAELTPQQLASRPERFGEGIIVL